MSEIRLPPVLFLQSSRQQPLRFRNCEGPERPMTIWRAPVMVMAGIGMAGSVRTLKSPEIQTMIPGIEESDIWGFWVHPAMGSDIEV
jgi:hypothetical protein